MQRIGHVAELWRFPVKSMGGERCASLRLDHLGVVGDRRFAFESREAPPGKPLLGSVQRASMLRFRASTGADSSVIVTTPGGDRLPVDSPALLLRFSALLAHSSPLTLLHHATPFTDVRPISLHASHVIRTLELELDIAFDLRRLRSNLVLDLAGNPPFIEEQLPGCTLRIGETVELQITERIPRCRMISLEPGTAVPDPTLLRHLARYHEGRAGIYARCTVPGLVHVGDAIVLLAADGRRTPASDVLTDGI